MKFYNYKVIEKLYYSDIVEEKETSTQYKQLLHKFNKLYNKILFCQVVFRVFILFFD